MSKDDELGKKWTYSGPWPLKRAFEKALEEKPMKASPYMAKLLTAPSSECPCGIHRADCEYHR